MSLSVNLLSLKQKLRVPLEEIVAVPLIDNMPLVVPHDDHGRCMHSENATNNVIIFIHAKLITTHWKGGSILHSS